MILYVRRECEEELKRAGLGCETAALLGRQNATVTVYNGALVDEALHKENLSR